MALVSVAGALVAALVLPMQELAQVLSVAVAYGILHTLDLEGATTSGGILDLLSQQKLAGLAVNWSRGTGIFLANSKSSLNASTVWVYILWGNLCLRIGACCWVRRLLSW
jgi:hypothetical protein